MKKEQWRQALRGVLDAAAAALRSKFAVKESQSLARVPDTLVFAFEFIMLPTPNEQAGDLEVLRRTILRLHPDLKARACRAAPCVVQSACLVCWVLSPLPAWRPAQLRRCDLHARCRQEALTRGAGPPRAQEKPHFWKRKPSIVKVHMLLLAHLARAEVPRSLQADLRFVLQKAPLLLEEMVKIANLPRPPAGYGWLSPSVGSLEMMQCITRAQQLHVRKTLAYGGKARAPAGSVGGFLFAR